MDPDAVMHLPPPLPSPPSSAPLMVQAVPVHRAPNQTAPRCVKISVHSELHQRFNQTHHGNSVWMQKIDQDSHALSLLLSVSPQEAICASVLHSQRFLLEMQARRDEIRERARHQKVKCFIISIAKHNPPKDYAGTHLCHVLQVPDLMEIIVREFQALRPGNRSNNLKALG